MSNNDNIKIIIIINGDNEDYDYSENITEDFPPINDNLENDFRVINKLKKVNPEMKEKICKNENL